MRAVMKSSTCPDCGGSGWKYNPNATFPKTTCTSCWGSGGISAWIYRDDTPEDRVGDLERRISDLERKLAEYDTVYTVIDGKAVKVVDAAPPDAKMPVDDRGVFSLLEDDEK